MTYLPRRPLVSALTLGRGRAGHLRNLISGLNRQDHMPCELIVAVMNDRLYDALPDTPFPIRQIHVPGDALPLARARNAVAAAAQGTIFAFLDIDCIPAPGWVADYARGCRSGAGAMMGEVLYLPKGMADSFDYGAFARAGVRHADRQGPPLTAIRRAEDYRVFWSLNFALHRHDWVGSGGFDPAYEGYGGEDTDFARTLFDRNIPLNWLRGAKAYHQHHEHCMPPIHHIPAILRNSEIFAQKWGHRTMEHWLRAFRLMGLIDENENGMFVRRQPNAADYALCRQADDMPYGASTTVLRKLETRASTRGAELAAQ